MPSAGKDQYMASSEGVTVGQSSYHRVLYGSSSSGRMELCWWAKPFTHTHNKVLFTVANIYYKYTVIQIHELSSAVDGYTLH
jgi:hypothetical protein